VAQAGADFRSVVLLEEVFLPDASVEELVLAPV